MTMAPEVAPTMDSDFERRQAALVDYALKKAAGHDPQSRDVATQAFNTSFATELVLNPEFASLFSLPLEMRQDVAASNIGRRAFKAFQAIKMLDNTDEMLQWESPDQWHEYFDTFVRPIYAPDADAEERARATAVHEARVERLSTYLHLPIASNVSERGKLLSAVIKLKGLNERPLKVVDFGCALNNVLKRTVLQSEDRSATAKLHRYGFTTIKNRAVDDIEGAVSYKRDERLTRQFNALVRGVPINLRDGVGVDILDMNDPFYRRWAEFNSLYIGELLVRPITEQFHAITVAQPENVRFLQADASNMNPDVIGEPADVAYLCTMGYQLTAE